MWTTIIIIKISLRVSILYGSILIYNKYLMIPNELVHPVQRAIMPIKKYIIYLRQHPKDQDWNRPPWRKSWPLCLARRTTCPCPWLDTWWVCGQCWAGLKFSNSKYVNGLQKWRGKHDNRFFVWNVSLVYLKPPD